MAVLTLTNEVRTEYPKGKPADPPVETPPEVKAEETEEHEDAKTKKKNGIEKRFSELTGERNEAKRQALEEKQRADKLAAELEEVRKASQPKDTKPKPEDFTDAVKFAEALADWRFAEKLKEQQQADAKARSESEAQRTAAEWQKKVRKAAKEIEDYHEIVDDSDIPVSYALRDAILDSDIGPKIQYYLVQNPDVVEEFNGLSVPKMLKAFGRLEAKLEAKEAKEEPTELPKKKIPAAPEPITPVKGIGATNLGPVDANGNVTGSFREFKEAYKAGRLR